MKSLHLQEKRQFNKLFSQEQIDHLEDRLEVLEVFLQTERHVTVTELVQQLHQNAIDLEPDFVRDTLKLMCHFGFAKKNRFDNGQVRYEHRHLGQHHDHMICTRCKKIVEFNEEELEALQIRVANEHGFHMLQHKMEIYGICADCLSSGMRLMPLEKAKPGERLVIKEIRGGSGARMRLMTMGLRVGDQIEVVTGANRGQLVVALDFKRYVLGRGLAQKILVEPTRQV